MTEITFHFNVPDRQHYSCRLLRRAYAAGASVVVVGQADALNTLDAQLWAMQPIEFTPHCRRETASAQSVLMSPIVLAESLSELRCDDVLMNLSDTVPTEFERFERLIEVVTIDEDDRAAARHRWKYYASRGYVLKRHDFVSTEDRQ